VAIILAWIKILLDPTGRVRSPFHEVALAEAATNSAYVVPPSSEYQIEVLAAL
jgi:hypothetical protein